MWPLTKKQAGSLLFFIFWWCPKAKEAARKGREKNIKEVSFKHNKVDQKYKETAIVGILGFPWTLSITFKVFTFFRLLNW